MAGGLISGIAAVGALGALASRFVVALVLLTAAIPKLAAMSEFERAVAGYRRLPAPAVRAVARIVPTLELTIAAALFVGLAVPVAAGGAALLLAGFAAVVAWGMAEGRTNACGCGTSMTARPIGWEIVAVDVGLAAMAAFAAVDAPRVLSVWPLAQADAVTPGQAIAILCVAVLAVLARMLVGAQREALRAADSLASRQQGGLR